MRVILGKLIMGCSVGFLAAWHEGGKHFLIRGLEISTVEFPMTSRVDGMTETVHALWQRCVRSTPGMVVATARTVPAVQGGRRLAVEEWP